MNQWFAAWSHLLNSVLDWSWDHCFVDFIVREKLLLNGRPAAEENWAKDASKDRGGDHEEIDSHSVITYAKS